MAKNEETNIRSGSTTFEWRRVKMHRPPEAKSAGSEATSLGGSLLPWPRGKPVTVVLKYRGGPEGWVEIRARGRIWRRPGVTALYDVLRDVMGWWDKGAGA